MAYPQVNKNRVAYEMVPLTHINYCFAGAEAKIEYGRIG